MLQAGAAENFSIRTQADALNNLLTQARPEFILESALYGLPLGHVAAVSSFGTEAAVLLHMIAQIEPRTPILFIDTGHQFAETLSYRRDLAARLGLTDVRTLNPDDVALNRFDPGNELWRDDPDLCCGIRKVEPVEKGLAGFCAWINGRKRYHGAERKALRVVEAEGSRLKFNPLARLDRAALQNYFERNKLPRHPLEIYSFSSIGCMPCTSRTEAGEDVRAGRWRGRGKSECGIHAMPGENTQSRNTINLYTAK
jgi:phosphoadenosine phosphosulfate reductase